LSQHLYIVSLGGNEFPPRFYKNDSYKTEVERYLEGSAATELYVDDGLPAEIRDAAISTLLPIFTLEPKHPVLANGRTFLMDHGRPVQQIPTNFASWLPVVSDVDGRILAGYFERVEGRPSEQWYLPPQIEGKALHRWLDILLKRWSLKEPENFPRISDWKADLRWQSPKERELTAAMAAEQETFEIARMAHEKTISELADQLVAAQALADTDHRVLLTAQGDTLKDKAAQTLRQSGFTVTDQDEHNERGDKLEDLRIEILGDNPWVSLIEVRGYKNGAQQSDLLRIGRFISRYQQENGGKAPEAAWYVNHSFQDGPSKRAMALAANPKEVQAFAESYNGLVIDTTALFKLRVAFEEKRLGAEQIRTQLMQQTGYFKPAF